MLVTLVVFLFLRQCARDDRSPSIAVPVSIVGTFGAMYLLGYSLDILSLMALTIATGFVVDDAIVVVENIERHIEAGMDAVEAAMLGASEVGFTVLSISLVADRGVHADPVHGRDRRPVLPRIRHDALGRHPDFAGHFADHDADALRAVHAPQADGAQAPACRSTRRSTACRPAMAAACPGPCAIPFVMVILALPATIGLNFYLYAHVPKGLFPQQDTGRLMGTLRGRPEHFLPEHQDKLAEMIADREGRPGGGDAWSASPARAAAAAAARPIRHAFSRR